MLFLEHLNLKVKKGIPTLIFKDKNGQELTFSQAIQKAVSRFLNYILDFELLILRITGFIPVYSIRWVIYILAGVRIGRGAHIHIGAQFFDPTNVVIGRGSIIGQNAFLDGRDKLIIGSHVDIASDVMIYNSEHNIHSEDFHPSTAPVEIEDYVFIGPRVIILPGVKIGKGAVVGAGAVVTKDVDGFKVVGGVPAQVIGERNIKNLHYTLGRARLFQ